MSCSLTRVNSRRLTHECSAGNRLASLLVDGVSLLSAPEALFGSFQVVNSLGLMEHCKVEE